MSTPKVNIQDLLKKLSFLRNNLALLVPIGIAVVALLLFVPTTLWSGKLRNRIETNSVQPGNQIDSLVQQVDQAAQAEALESYIEAYAQDANAIDDLMVQTTLRELLDYRVFEDPNHQTSQLVFDPFRQKYVAGVDAMLQRLQAGSPPSEADILAALESSGSRSMMGRSRPRAPVAGGNPMGRGLNLRFMSEVDRRIATKVCEDKAKTAKVYLNPVDLGGYLYWSDWKFEDWDKAIRDCWYWQMAYWMLEDVATTIQQMNQDADHILHAPVKRVMNVLFTQSQSRMGMGMGMRSALGRGRRTLTAKDQQTPTYATGVKNAMTGTPCTGRFSSVTSDWDVMQFEVRVIVSAADVMRFMQALCSAKPHQFRGWLGQDPVQKYQHNQITILESSINPVDRESFEHSSYQYGDGEVVDLDLVCEYLFCVKAYDKIMPKQVKDDIAGLSDNTK